MADPFIGGSGGGGYMDGGSRRGGESSGGAADGLSSGAAHSFTEYGGMGLSSSSGHQQQIAGGGAGGGGSSCGYYHRPLPPIHYITDQLLVTALPERRRATSNAKSSAQRLLQHSESIARDNDGLVDIGMDLSDQEEEFVEVEEGNEEEEEEDDDGLDERYREESLAALACFLKDRHSFLVFSLADELPDESFVNAIQRQVVHLPWQAAGSPMSEIPTVGTLLHICYALSAWLGDDESDHQLDDTTGDDQDIEARDSEFDQRRERRRVAVIACSNGRTRTALACACFLHFSGQVENGVRDGFCHFCLRTFSHHLYAGGGAAGGGGAHAADNDGIAAAACLETPLDVWKELPPSLLLLLNNFETALSLGYMQRKPLCLRAIALQGLPVEEKPRLDLFDGQGRHLYSSHDPSINNMKNNINNNNIRSTTTTTTNQNADTALLLPVSHWADEEGFFKVNVLVEGDFCLLCRFGGTVMPFQTSSGNSINNNDDMNNPNKDDDATRILFRYANTTGFLSATPAALELPLSRVDVMRRYAPFFDPHDFLLSILWESDWTNPHENNSQLRQESSSDVLTPIYKAIAARQEGWYLIWKHHVVGTCTPGWDDLVQDFITCDAKPAGEYHQNEHGDPPPPQHLVSLALCLANLDPVMARFLLLRGRLQSWWKGLGINQANAATSTTTQDETEPNNDSLAITSTSALIEKNVRRRRRLMYESDAEAQTVLSVLDSVDVSAFVQDTDLTMAQIKPTAAWRLHQQQGEIDLKQCHVDGGHGGINSSDLPFESAIMKPNRGDVRNALLALPQRQAESAGSFHGAAGSRFGVLSPNSSLASSRPHVPVLHRLKNVAGEASTAEQLQLLLLASSSSSSPLDDPENDAAVDLLLQGLNHTGVGLTDLVKLVHQSHEWNLEDGESLTQKLATTASSPKDEATTVEDSSAEVGQSSADSCSIHSNPNEARQCNGAPHIEKGRHTNCTPAAATGASWQGPQVENIAVEMTMMNKGGPMKEDVRFEKYWKMRVVGLPDGAIRNALVRDGMDVSIWDDLDWDKNYEAQIALSPTITDLPMKQDSRFEKYWKMKSVGLPEGAIRNAILRDGKDGSIWDLDWDKNYEEQMQRKESAGPPMKQDSRFEKYWKMKGVGLPEGAIRNAIARDGKDDSIWDLDWGINYEEQMQPKANTGPPMKQDSRFEKYWKMKCVGLPDGAVRNAVVRDGLDASILDLSWEQNYEAQTKKDKDDDTAIKDDPRFERYWKMKSVGLPDGAIRNAMIRDGADPSVLDLDWERSIVSQTTTKAKEDEGVPLKDDPEYTKFFKMLDMGLTKDAVKNALEREGKDPAIMELDPNKSASIQKQPDGGSRSRTSIIPQKRVRRKKIYWNPIDPGKIKEDSLWSLVRGRSMSLLEFDAEEFEELFTESAEPNEQKITKNAASAGKAKAKKAVQVIDGKRSMNGGIILSRLRIEYKKIAGIVRNMDHGAFDATQLKALKDFLPTNEERQGLQRYIELAKSEEAKKAAYSGLSECEKYMFAMIDVPNAQKKFDCMLFREQFHSRFNELVTSIRTLELACDEVKGSKSLREILGIILIVVNRINTGGIGNEAAGFSLEALLKLNEAKAFDKKTSVLHYLVKLVKRNDESLLEFQKDLSHVRQAQNIMLDSLLTEIKELREELEIIYKTAQEDADQLPPGEKRAISLKELKEQITLVRCIADVKHYNQTDHVTGRTPMERFAMNATASTQTAMTMTEEVKQKYDKVLEYFGEAKDMLSNDFFGTMNRFLMEFSKAIEQVQREEAALLRKLKNAASSAKKAISPKGQPKKEKALVGGALLTSGVGSVPLSNEPARETISVQPKFGAPLDYASDISGITSPRLYDCKRADVTIDVPRTDVSKKATETTARKSTDLVSKATETTVVAKKPRVWARSKSPTTQDRLGIAAAAAAAAMCKRKSSESDVVGPHVSDSSMNFTLSNSSLPKDTNLNGSKTHYGMNGSVDTAQSDGSRSSRHPGGIATAAALAAKKKQLLKSIGDSSRNETKRVGIGDTPASLPTSSTSGDSVLLGSAPEKPMHSASADDKARLISQELHKSTSTTAAGIKGTAAFDASAKSGGMAAGGFGISPGKRMERSSASDHGISVLAKNHQVREHSRSSPESRLEKVGSQTSSNHAPTIILGSQTHAIRPLPQSIEQKQTSPERITKIGRAGITSEGKTVDESSAKND